MAVQRWEVKPMSMRKSWFIATALILAISSPAFAIPTTLTLVQEAPQSIGPQSTSNPCIIAATTCQQPAGLAYNNFVSTGNISAYNESQSYTVDNFRSFAGNVFNVAIDVNTSNAAGEILDLFTLTNTTTGMTLFQYSGGYNIGALSSNGNGYADFTLRTFDITNLQGTDQITFNAVWHNASSGGESFFVIPGTHSVPEPNTFWLLAVGLLLFLAYEWRQRPQAGGIQVG